MAKPPNISKVRCAIYTRKSTEEGLEQDFNTLDAQREACEAYVMSQIHEGWTALPRLYDDGGYSGGNLKRPALKRLLADIEDGKVDVVVVYKVDRLTRSLADFARIVDIFDTRDASFVSVTQAFNTTTSMGRLTLNVLLSFAQFEREVTGERIRDKIAASKKKGMWMGGNVPLGYDVKDRKLIINQDEAETVTRVFGSYLELGSVDTLERTLNADGIVSKIRINKHGKQSGGQPLARGALYHMLQNPIYQGRIPHKEVSYPGEHEAIVAEDLWDNVQGLLGNNRNDRKVQSNSKDPSLLAGMLYDANDTLMTPSHAVRRGKRYRYYVEGGIMDKGTKRQRIPAGEIEDLVRNRIQRLLASPGELHEALGVLELSAETLSQTMKKAAALSKALPGLSRSDLRKQLLALDPCIVLRKTTVTINLNSIRLLTLIDPGTGNTIARDACRIYPSHLMTIKAELRRAGIGTKLHIEGTGNTPDPALVRLIVKAQQIKTQTMQSDAATLKDLAAELGMARSYLIRVIRLTLLAPDIIKAILSGNQPPELSARKLMSDTRFPPEWNKQRAQLGFTSGFYQHSKVKLELNQSSRSNRGG
jgi:DNA invertase Pin-like site-specific DNA recombinase